MFSCSMEESLPTLSKILERAMETQIRSSLFSLLAYTQSGLRKVLAVLQSFDIFYIFGKYFKDYIEMFHSFIC